MKVYWICVRFLIPLISNLSHFYFFIREHQIYCKRENLKYDCILVKSFLDKDFHLWGLLTFLILKYVLYKEILYFSLHCFCQPCLKTYLHGKENRQYAFCCTLDLTSSLCYWKLLAFFYAKTVFLSLGHSSHKSHHWW